ncbi:helix-turn-helix domain-containing protein [Aneurinibacillus tyrosinisolvens]|uniref:helix-turn-helix domain-containing protein n=1 Tax=Aneurinibacillus tyrosinisolvens TaxID=1443435 RepID=UPI00063F6383|nr:helix-turn-helix domain-containing protein [Aneurinibacillus tyrosinisolvens]
MQIELIQLRQQLLQAELLKDAAESFASSLHFDEIMTQILDKSLQVIQAADAGALFLYDKEDNVLRPAACAGFEWEELRNVILIPGESMTGYTYQKKLPQIYERTFDVDKGMHTMDPKNKPFYERALQSIRKLHGGELILRSVMCTPLLIKNDCIGVITIDNFSSDVSFTNEDLRLLVTLANQAAVALENARLYQSERNRREQLEELNQIIQAQRDQLFRINVAHQQLMKQVLSGDTLEDMAVSIHTILKNPILIYDPLLCVVGECGVIDIQAKIPPFLSHLQKMLNDWSPKRILPSLQVPLSCPVMLIPIVTSEKILGILAVLESNHEFEQQDMVLAEQCGIVLALDLLNHEAIYETEQRYKGEFLDDLISEKNIEILKERAKILSLSSEEAYLFMIVNFQLKGSSNTLLHHIQKMIEKDILNRNPNSLVVNRYNHSIILVGWPKKTTQESVIKRSRGLANGIITTMERLYPNIECCIGIGRMCKKIEEFVQSYEEAKQCITLIQSQNGKNIFRDYREIGAVRFMLDRSREDLVSYVNDLLSPLLQYPTQKRIEFLKTLDAYIVSGRSVKEAASELNILPNTLVYRIKRIEEILGFSMDDYSNYFNLSFAWKILETYGIKEEILEKN